MFGYVRPPQDLPEEERRRFGRAYCGLCHALGERYGPAARFILNYDFTFLAILLTAGAGAGGGSAGGAPSTPCASPGAVWRGERWTPPPTRA